MTKNDIIEAVYGRLGAYSKKEVGEVVDTVFEAMKDALVQGGKVKVSGVGNFVVKQKNERIGRNPKTGEEITISARKVLTFKPSPVLRKQLND
jgi:integration host factor subunit alpha